MAQEQPWKLAHRRSGPGLVQELGVLQQRPVQWRDELMAARGDGWVLVAGKPTSSPKGGLILIFVPLPSIAVYLALSQVPWLFLCCHEGHNTNEIV